MLRESVLVVDDEADIVELVRYNLSQSGFDTLTASDGAAALEIARTRMPKVIVLDLMLPGMNGLDVCRNLKRDPKTANIAIVMLTACGDEPDIVAGLELGADDYITKPFSPRVLVARVRAVLRRTEVDVEPSVQNDILNCHGIRIDPRRFEVTIDGAKLDLTSTEFKILDFLCRNRGFVYTRAQIVDSVHGEDYPVTDRSIDVQVVGLRRKLGTAGDVIETVRGVGYRVKE